MFYHSLIRFSQFSVLCHAIQRVGSRRPFLHIIVLFASDPRVMQFSKELQNVFLENGVDVWMQTELLHDKQGSV